MFFFWAFLKKYIKYRDMARTFGLEVMPAIGPKRFSFSEIKNATNDFTDKIGKGGFGDVYKGKLSDGRVVAVKCLKNVKGGDAEFWAEVTIIARMHHLNLVRLWGFVLRRVEGYLCMSMYLMVHWVNSSSKRLRSSHQMNRNLYSIGISGTGLRLVWHEQLPIYTKSVWNGYYIVILSLKIFS